MCLQSAKKRQIELNDQYLERLKFEIETIDKMGYCSYFLIVQDYVDYAKTQTAIIKKEFKAKFDELDAVLEKKLSELKDCATDAENTDKIIQQTKDRLAWLENIQTKIEAILEI